VNKTCAYSIHGRSPAEYLKLSQIGLEWYGGLQADFRRNSAKHGAQNDAGLLHARQPNPP
jgi:hypothetical protein